MATVMPAYTAAADTLRLAARQAAAKTVDPHDEQGFGDLYLAVERLALARVRARLDEAPDPARVLLAGILAAHAVAARQGLDPDTARDILPALWDDDLTPRLAAQRVAEQVMAPTPHTEGVRRLLRTVGAQRVAAAGQLARDVVRSGPDGYAQAWYAVCGTYLLLARRAAREAAVGMVRGGAQKTYVARRGDLSRTTLDAWLAD